MSDELAALTIASDACRVMSPTETRTRPPRKIVLICSGNEDSTRPPKKIHGGRLRGKDEVGRMKDEVKAVLPLLHPSSFRLSLSSSSARARGSTLISSNMS